MKYIIYILFFVCFGLSVKAQSGFPSQTWAGWIKPVFVVPDSGSVISKRDTNWTPSKPAMMVTWFHAGADTTQWFWTGLNWKRVSAAQLDTTSLSNRINLKLNISDTASMLSPYLRKIDTTNKWVQNVYARNDSLFKLKNGTETFVHVVPTNAGGTVTSIGISVPAAMSVTPSTITTSGTFNFSGAGLASQYVKGDFTLGTTDTSMIPNFFSKVRSEFSGTSPITYNSTTGIIGILNANSTGQKGAATFNNSDFTDNGSALISLAPIGSGGSCLNCQLTIDTKGRITSFADGSIFLLSNAPGAGDTLVVSGDTIKRIYASYGLISTPTASSIALRVDTTLIQKLITANNGLTKTGNNIQLGGTLIQPTPITSAAGANRIIYSGVSSFADGAQLDVSTTGSAGIGVRGQTTDGRGIFGVATTGVGVYGTATGTGGYGLFGLSTLGNAIYGRADSGLIWEGAMVPHSNNTIIPARSTTRASQALGANGIGYSDDSYLQTSTGSNRLSNQIIYKLTNATDASYASSFEFWNANNATLARKMAIAGNGQITLDQYTGTNFQTIDTSFNALVVDGSGNVFKKSGNNGGGGDTLFSQLKDVSISSPKNGNVPVYDSTDSKWHNRVPPFYNVADWGIFPDSTDIRAKLIKLRDMIVSSAGSGIIFFPAGTKPYYLSDSVVFNNSMKLLGVAPSGGLHNFQNGGLTPADRLGPVQLSSTICVLDGKNGIIFDSAVNGNRPLAIIEGLTFISTATPGSTTSSSFIVLRGMLQDPIITKCTFYGGYVQVDKQSAYYAKITENHFSAPQKACIKMQNTIRTDTGDDLVFDNIFSSGTFNTITDSTRAIWWTSGGGFKFSDNKVDASEFNNAHAFVYDLYIQNPLAPTSDILLTHNSFENWAITSIFMRGIASPYVRNIQITSNQFAPVGSTGSAIDINQMSEILIGNNLFRDWGGTVSAAAMKITNSSNVVIGKHLILNYTSNTDVTGSTGVHIDYELSGDVAIGSYNTTNIAGLNTSLYTTETILGRATSSTNGGGVIELASQLPDGSGADIGYVDFSSNSNVSIKRMASIGAVTDGTTANNRGGKLIGYVKADGGALREAFNFDNGRTFTLTGYGSGTFSGTPNYNLSVTSSGTVIETRQWINNGSDIYYNTGNVAIGKSTGISARLDIQTNSAGSDGIFVTNTNSGVAARPVMRLVNNAGELGQFGMMSSTHATLPNFTLMEATKSFQIGVDQGIASGGTSVINFVTGGFSVAPSFIIKGTGTVNASSLAGSGTRMVVANSTGDLSTQTIGNTLYSGDGTLAGNRIVTGSNNNLTFATIGNYRINSNAIILSKNDATFPYTAAILGSDNSFQLGYTPTATVFSKGSGILIDTNNNASLGTTQIPSTAPLYATGGSTYVNGFQNQAGNFLRVDSITTNITATLTQYEFRINAAGGNITITLPALSTAFAGAIGIHYVFKRLDSSGNTVTIAAAGANLIDGASSITLTTQYQSKELQAASSTSWDVK